ncbi:MAG: DNA polymerase III subunit alpha [Weeksellaceae bacterium]|nr:DNA polymerase III subunit alpha [Weeksellaceae bacterium]
MLLNVHSYYSLRYGVLSEDEILEMCVENGYDTVALTDVNNTSACLNFIKLAPQYGIKPVVGIDCKKGVQTLYVLLARSNQGFENMNAWISPFLHARKALPVLAPELDDVVVVYPVQHVVKHDIVLKGHQWAGISAEQLPQLAYSITIPESQLVVLQTFSFRHKVDFNTHRLLRSIDHNVLLSQLGEHRQALATETLRSKDVLLQQFAHHPQIVRNTEALLDACHIHFTFDKTSQNLKTYTGSAAQDIKLLRELCAKYLPERYPTTTPQIMQRLHKELDTIEQMNFVPFFLINWDIVSWAEQQGFFHVGRGSGANSMVAYLLRITDVDPIDLDLYFERFMNLYRNSPPDFDIDFSWRDRDAVTQYIFQQFGGSGQTALLATYSTFRHSAAVRELGKVFGLPKHEIDVLSDRKYDPKKLDTYARYVLHYAEILRSRPNLRSVHAGGILIAEKPIHHFTATDLPPKGYPTTHFDMVIAEEVGLFKYDILGQRGLGKIKEATEIIAVNQPQAPAFDIHDVQKFKQDPQVNAMLQKGDTMGCFYVESPAMRMLISKLQVNDYLGLVAASSVIRPGVSSSGMMREYILRHRQPELRQRAHPALLALMPETYGVMVYQEDVIKVAHHFGGLTLGEADVLRRGMSGKQRSKQEMQNVQEKFLANCRAKGYTEQTIQEIWQQIESFAGYAFAKGHSASYAVESYQSLYLRRYYPLEYAVAVLNNGGGYYRAEAYVNDARLHGADIQPPCINQSRYDTSIQGKTIYLGFGRLHGLESDTAAQILHSRTQDGPFTDFNHFMQRVPLPIDQVSILIRINAFRSLGHNRRQLLWLAHTYHHQPPKHTQQVLFHEPQHTRQYQLPNLHTHVAEDAFEQVELLGFPLCNPFDLLAEPVDTQFLARHLALHIHKNVRIYGYLITTKYVRTSHGQIMHFGTFTDAEGRWIDTVHFPPVAKKHPFQGLGVYELFGTVTSEFEYITLQVTRMRKVPFIADPRFNEG